MERPFDGQFPHEESDDAYAAYLEDRVQKSMQNNLAMANAMTRKEQERRAGIDNGRDKRIRDKLKHGNLVATVSGEKIVNAVSFCRDDETCLLQVFEHRRRVSAEFYGFFSDEVKLVVNNEIRHDCIVDVREDGASGVCIFVTATGLPHFYLKMQVE